MLNKRSEVLVDGSERYRRHLMTDVIVHFFRTGMTLQVHQRLPDDLALMCHRDSVCGTELAESFTGHTSY